MSILIGTSSLSNVQSTPGILKVGIILTGVDSLCVVNSKKGRLFTGIVLDTPVKNTTIRKVSTTLAGNKVSKIFSINQITI